MHRNRLPQQTRPPPREKHECPGRLLPLGDNPVEVQLPHRLAPRACKSVDRPVHRNQGVHPLVHRHPQCHPINRQHPIPGGGTRCLQVINQVMTRLQSCRIAGRCHIQELRHRHQRRKHGLRLPDECHRQPEELPLPRRRPHPLPHHAQRMDRRISDLLTQISQLRQALGHHPQRVLGVGSRISALDRQSGRQATAGDHLPECPVGGHAVRPTAVQHLHMGIQLVTCRLQRLRREAPRFIHTFRLELPCRAQLVQYRRLLRLGRVHLKAEWSETGLFQSPTHHLQSGYLLRNEQHRLSRRKQVRDQVRDRLALARPGWAVQHETAPLGRRHNRRRL